MPTVYLNINSYESNHPFVELISEWLETKTNNKKIYTWMDPNATGNIIIIMIIK